MAGTIADIRCPDCGAPAQYDIIRQDYHCAYCGGSVKVREAIAQKKGFRRLQQEKIRKSAEGRSLMHANCTGCGAELVFEESEAQSSCAFCGATLVRKDYIASKELPEMIIPFRITKEEAAQCLSDWCRKNAGKDEAKHLKGHENELQGFYLPYELIRGPVGCKVSRMDSARSYFCSGYVDRVFVNSSKQLDNRLLDAMEPYELEDLKEFDFAYTAGQRIKIRDTDDKEFLKKIQSEVSDDYRPTVEKTLGTKALDIDIDPQEAVRMPLLLPAYYIRTGGSSDSGKNAGNGGKEGKGAKGGTIAAVNGQTGKVSVLAEKPSHYYFLPWWLKAILATAVICLVTFAGMTLFGADRGNAIICTGVLGLITLIVTLCAYSDTIKNSFQVESERKVFTSSGGSLRRSGRDGEHLVQDARNDAGRPSGSAAAADISPVFFEKIDGKQQPVQLVFSSMQRKLRTAALAVIVLFLPVIIALFLNGFDFRRLELGGSAVWFCIMVPVIPIYILKFSVIELYERPWIYLLSEDGSRKRYKGKKADSIRPDKDLVKSILRALIVPPASLGIWFAILCFITMCYLTAFGFD